MIPFATIALRLRLALALLIVIGTTGSALAQSLPAQVTAAPAAATASTGTGAGDAVATALKPEAITSLIAVLKDDAARQALIDDLDRISKGTATADAAPGSASSGEAGSVVPEAPAAKPATDALSATPYVRDLGAATVALAKQVFEVGVKVVYGLGNLRRLADGTAAFDWQSLGNFGLETAAALAIAILVYNLALAVVRRLIVRLDSIAAHQRWIRRVAWTALAFAAEILALALALIVADFYAIFVAGGGEVDPLTTQVLGGFVTVETMRLIVDHLFQWRFPALATLLPCAQETARFWNPRLSRLVGFVGYGVLVAHAAVARLFGFSVGIGFRMGVVLIALAMAIVLILRNRDAVQRDLIGAIASIEDGFARSVLTLAIHVWHLLAILYLTVAFLLWVSRPFDAVHFMAKATLETLLIIIVGGGLSRLIARWTERGIRMPNDFHAILPTLEERINMVVPHLLRTIRLVILISVAAFVLEAWGLVDFWGWATAGAGADVVGRVTSAFFIVLVAVVVWLAASSWVEFQLNSSLARNANPRTRTLFSLFRNAFTVVIVVIAGMLTLSTLGIDIAPLIAGAGVVGLAVGFGSQKLVQDIITGAFIQLENAMNEGDVVTVAGISGVVDRLTIRSVGIRDLDGVYHVVPFSSVSSVSNFMRGFSYHVANIGVAYKEDIGKVKAAMQTAFERLMATDRGPTILEPLEMHGVTEFGDNAITVRARIKTMPGEQWSTGRTYNELIKAVFDEEGIEIPFPQRTVWMAKDEPSAAGAANAESIVTDPRASEAPPASGESS